MAAKFPDASDECPLKALIVSRWDNVLGPHWIYIRTPIYSHWVKSDGTPTSHDPKMDDLSQQWVKYATTHTLEHVNAPSPDDSLSSSIVLVPDLNLAYFSVSFSCVIEDSQEATPHSYAFMVEMPHLSTLLRIKPMLYQWAKRTVPQFKVLLAKSELSQSKLDAWADEVWEAVDERSKVWASKLDVPLENVLKLPGLDLALTSHLQTFGNSIIIGSCSDGVNLLVCFLTLFLDEEDQYCCQPVMSDGGGGGQFQSGLFVQGLLQEESGECNLPSIAVTCNPYPVTLIHMEQKEHGAGNDEVKVRQSALFKAHCQEREKALKQELFDLWTGAHQESQTTENVLHTVKESSRFAKTLVSDLAWIPVSNWPRRIQMFKKVIYTKVVALLLFLSSKREKENGSDPTPVTRKTVCAALDLTLPDLFVVLAAAEKLRPGTYNRVD